VTVLKRVKCNGGGKGRFEGHTLGPLRGRSLLMTGTKVGDLQRLYHRIIRKGNAGGKKGTMHFWAEKETGVPLLRALGEYRGMHGQGWGRKKKMGGKKEK